MEQVLLVLHIIVAFLIIGLVLLQQGKGSDVGSAFGSGASQTVFGSQGSATFFSRSTAWLTAILFSTSIGMVHLEHQSRAQPTKSVTELPFKAGPSPNVNPANSAEDIPSIPKSDS
jgi:preprotein translocase subunit SecG